MSIAAAVAAPWFCVRWLWAVYGVVILWAAGACRWFSTVSCCVLILAAPAAYGETRVVCLFY